MTNKATEFWQVVTETPRSPSITKTGGTYTSFEVADRKAKEAAKAHPGDTVYIMHTIKAYGIPKPEAEEIAIEPAEPPRKKMPIRRTTMPMALQDPPRDEDETPFDDDEEE